MSMSSWWKRAINEPAQLLLTASRSGDIKTVVHLIVSGVNVNNLAYYSRYNPLSYALDGKHVNILKVLIASGANANEAKLDFTRFRKYNSGRQCVEVFIANGLGSHYFQWITRQTGEISTWAKKIDQGVKRSRDVIVILLGLKKLRRIPTLQKIDRFLIKQCLAVEIWTTRLDTTWQFANK